MKYKYQNMMASPPSLLSHGPRWLEAYSMQLDETFSNV